MSFPLYPLSALGVVQTGSTPSTAEERYWGGDVPFVTPAELEQSQPITDTPRSLSEDGAAQARLLDEEAVLVCCIGSLGKIGMAGRKLATNQQINSIQFDRKKIFPRYGYYACQKLRPRLQAMAPATTVPIVSKSKFEQLEIPVPPLPEQRRIAAILDQADALRAKRREALALLDELLRGIFVEFQKSIQRETRQVALGSLAVNSRGSFVNGPFGSDLLTSELTEEGVPVIYIRDIRTGEYRRVSDVCVSESKAEQLSVCTVQPGDVLVAKVGDPPGVAAVYPATEAPAIVTQDVIRIRPDLYVALPEFIQGYLNSSIGRLKIKEITVEATRARFSLGDFKKLLVELPPLPAQKVLVNKIKQHQALTGSHRQALRELDELFMSIQDRAFRGEL